MAITIVQRQKLLQQVERVLHVPGNFTKEILEMALVLDCAMEKEELEDTVIELVKNPEGPRPSVPQCEAECTLVEGGWKSGIHRGGYAPSDDVSFFTRDLNL